MEVDIPDSVIIEQTKDKGVEYLANYVQSGGYITPGIREHIVSVLRGNFTFKTGPKRKTDGPEAKVIFEIGRIMFFWGVKAYRAKKMLLDYYPDLEEETVKSYWAKHRANRPKKTRTVSSIGDTTIASELNVLLAPSLQLTPIIMEFLNFVAMPDNRGKLANTDYPEGYQTIGVTTLNF